MPGGVLPGKMSVNVITADTHARVDGAFVAIENATDTAVIYATGHTFPNGSCDFSGVSSTGGQSAYRVFTSKDGYYNGYSNAFPVCPSGNVSVSVVLAPPDGPYPVFPGIGNVTGRIKAAYGSGLAGATVPLMNSKAEIEYARSMTGSDGKYSMTAAFVSPGPAFKIIVKMAPYPGCVFCDV